MNLGKKDQIRFRSSEQVKNRTRYRVWDRVQSQVSRDQIENQFRWQVEDQVYEDQQNESR